ncbi:alpha-galactosidase [Aureibacillus halotolerans]|uniref:Alpha-galactosidase n=1 Tax=Aureibacillus halotolerans TaxID=1508390 RepID=A0A4R6U432_9BACI|nr:alpha-galactosidase [Aureibacillus halotolerans]TDQ40841.1 alpha-galactosidase [Aureibacillus halotolerans]
MAILVEQENQQFHLTNGQLSYIFHVMKNGQLGHLYYGKALTHRSDFSHLQRYDLHTPNTSHPYVDDPDFSMETSRQEYPVYGTTDFREPALHVLQSDGSHITNFEYVSHEMFAGKKALPQMPATYTNEGSDAETLEIHLFDSHLGVELTLSYTLFRDLPILTRHTVIKNNGANSITLDRVMSGSVDLPHSDYDMVQLSGAWSRERHVKTRTLESGIQAVSSLRGSSSHQQNPFLALKSPEATEHTGDVYGFSLVYSSNFLAQVEVDQYDVARVLVGIHPFGFSWTLSSGETFTTPELVMAYSPNGLNGMSQAFHRLFQAHLVRGEWKHKDRPVLINNWEATYFNFDEQKLMNIVHEAKDLGVELFVLDDGWFGKRNNDTTSLGDWYVDEAKLPNGLGALAANVREAGLEFGLWFEVEMVSPVSELHKNHPEWVIQTPGRNMSLGRNQRVLDFTKQEVVDYIFERMSAVIKETKLSYIKWDMNRNITEAYSATLRPDQQGEFFHRYILGMYQLYERLTTAFPQVLFESCAAGGGRFDPGMLYYAPQAWTSDDTDAVERLKIQYGTSFVYPLSTMGAHVSDIPNHQTLRETSLRTRTNVAYFGLFGYELDPTSLSEEDKQQIKIDIKTYKMYRHLIRTGQFVRLQSPFTEGPTAWMVINEDKTEALVGYYKALASPTSVKMQTLKVAGISEESLYTVQELSQRKSVELYGDELMYSGLPLLTEFNGANRAVAETGGDGQSALYHLKRKEL